MKQSGGTRGVLVVVIAAVATLGLVWYLNRPIVDPIEAPEGASPSAPEEVAKADAPSGEPEATPIGDSLPVWKASDGTLHIGDDPPPESQELGKVTAQDARALHEAMAGGAGPSSTGVRVEELMSRIRQDTARRPIADADGDPTWSVRDIEGVVASDEALDVSTDWVTNATMIRVAKRLCRYVSAQSDVFEPGTVVVRGRGGRILARCKAVG